MSLLCTEVSAGACPCSKQPAAGRIQGYLHSLSYYSWLNPIPFTNQLFFETGSHTVQAGLEPHCWPLKLRMALNYILFLLLPPTHLYRITLSASGAGGGEGGGGRIAHG